MSDTELKQIIYDLLQTSKSDASKYATADHLKARAAAVVAIKDFEPGQTPKSHMHICDQSCY